MKPRSSRLVIYGAACAFIVICAAVMHKPFMRAWECYERYADAPRATGEFVEVLEKATVLRLVDGPRTGETCTVPVAIDDPADGERFAVAYLADTPERCELVETVEFARVVLWSVVGGMVCCLFLVAVGALAANRGLVRPAQPQRLLETTPAGVACATCGNKMAEGAVIPTAPLHWRDVDQPIGLTPLFNGLPGTVTWRKRRVLHAFRCERCEVITLQYGLPDG